MGIPRVRPTLGIISGERRAAVLSSYKRAYSLSTYGTRRGTRAAQAGGTRAAHPRHLSCHPRHAAPIAPALPPVPMGTSVVLALAKPVTPMVAAAPLQLQLQELLMQALEQMAEEEAEVM